MASFLWITESIPSPPRFVRVVVMSKITAPESIRVISKFGLLHGNFLFSGKILESSVLRVLQKFFSKLQVSLVFWRVLSHAQPVSI